MLGPMTWMLATAVSLTTAPAVGAPKQIDVDCESGGALERALVRAEKLDKVEIVLHGVCTGNFMIATDGVTLRGATPDSGIAAPRRNPSRMPVLEVVDARANLLGMVVQGGQGADVGVFVHGWDAEVLLFNVDVHVEDGFGVFSERGAHVRLFDTTIRDGLVGVTTQFNSTATLSGVTVSNQRVGVIVFDKSSAGISDTTIENSSEVGLSVSRRSDVNVLGGVFRENGGVHVNARDWSSITLLFEPTIGSATDATPYALSALSHATIASYGTSAIYGNAFVSDGGSIRIGNTVLDGDLILVQFANAHVRDAEITGVVVCVDGSDAICRQTTTAGAFGCVSSSCGPATAEAIGRAPSASAGPEFDAPRLERPLRLRSRP